MSGLGEILKSKTGHLEPLLMPAVVAIRRVHEIDSRTAPIHPRPWLHSCQWAPTLMQVHWKPAATIVRELRARFLGEP